MTKPGPPCWPQAFERQPAEMRGLLDYLRGWYPLIACGAWEGDRLAAAYSCLLRPLRLPGQAAPVQVGMSINMAVHRDYRGRGLVKQVAAPVYAELQARGAVAGVGFSNAAGVQVDRHSSAYGYRVLGQMRPYLALNPGRFSGPALPLSGEALPADLPILLPRQIAFDQQGSSLAWQINAHPFRRFRLSWGPSGLVIDQPFRWQGLRATVLMAAYGGDLDSLLRGWLAMPGQARLIRTLLSPGSDLLRALRRCLPLIPAPYTRRPYYLTVKPLDGADSLLDFGSWSCMTLDIL